MTDKKIDDILNIMLLIFLFHLFTNFAFGDPRPLTVAVIDTGFGYSRLSKNSPHLCKFGHKDFTRERSFDLEQNTVDAVPMDYNGHGTNIAGVIVNNVPKNVKFCIIIIKYYSLIRFHNNLQASIDAIKYATRIKADYINYSSGGEEESTEESTAIKAYLDGGGVFVAAAGNENKDLTKTPYYPAMSDKRIVVVGNLFKDKIKSSTSNFGSPVTRWEYGEVIGGYGVFLTGTSQACAVATGKLIGEKNNNMIKVK